MTLMKQRTKNQQVGSTKPKSRSLEINEIDNLLERMIKDKNKGTNKKMLEIEKKQPKQRFKNHKDYKKHFCRDL